VKYKGNKNKAKKRPTRYYEYINNTKIPCHKVYFPAKIQKPMGFLFLLRELWGFNF